MSGKSYLVGIAGPSGAGKSYLAHHLADRLQGPVLALDRYYRDLAHLLPEERERCNFDDPAALEDELLFAHAQHLQGGRPVEIPVYDFSTHTRSGETQLFRPGQFVIVEGLFTLYWPKLRRILDTQVYVDMADDICLQRRQERDVHERGRTPESVLEQFRTTVLPMAERYVRPTQSHAHVVLVGSAPISEEVERVLENVRQNIGQRGTPAMGDRVLASPSVPSP